MTYNPVVILSTHAGHEDKPLDGGLLDCSLDILRHEAGTLDDVDVLIQGRGDVEDGVRAGKVEGCSVVDVALHSLETRVGLEFGGDFSEIAVVTLDGWVGSVGEKGADGGLARPWGSWDNGNLHGGVWFGDVCSFGGIECSVDADAECVTIV